jgi:hypothetical protein
MTKLFTTTVGAGGSASVTFSNIPQNYTDLCIKISCRTDRAADEGGLGVQLNNATTGQTYRVLAGSGSDGTSSVNTAYEPLWVCRIQGGNAGAGIFSSTDLYIQNYSGNTAKTISADSATEKNATIAYITMSSVLQSSPAPVTSITLSGISGTFQQHSTFTLYGVKNAAKTAGNSIKATGGNISFDGTYVTHTFTSTGAFTPTQPLLVDYLVVAGGGGGFQGGGGAGGLRSTVTATGGGGTLESALSLASGIAQTVTIGAGGAAQTSGANSSFSTIASTGGGRGGSFDNSTAPSTGGSGGGGGGADGAGYSGAAGTANQGRAGGTGFAQSGVGPAGGGGGSANVGSNGVSGAAGAGGSGVGINITGSSVTYAGGGGGGIYNDVDAGSGGAGGGGAGGFGNSPGTAGTAGTANTGSGGGGAGFASAGAGGSGVVIIRYKG